MCDNQVVLNITILPQSTMGRKYNALNYHVLRKAAASGILWVGKEYTENNLADILTKMLLC